MAQMLQKGWVDRRVVKETLFEMVWACIENRRGYRSGYINKGGSRDTREGRPVR